ncbi:MAG: hypothetical protein HIU82_06865 [Proteobacteria bacterium]|nr:hypothetical protein [Pseudomonadota bacterium]
MVRLLATLPLLRGPGSALPPGAPVRLTPLADPAIPANPFRHGTTLLVAGPVEGPTHRWAQLVAPALARGLAPGAAITLSDVGGQDGVTAANQFGARVSPDGRTLLFTPGAAVLAWLAGEPRVKFDVGGWVPVCAAASPAVLMGSFAASSLRDGAVVRLAVDRLPGPGLAGLLALALLGGVPRPVAGLGPTAADAALLRGELDAVLLTGEGVAARAARLIRAGALPLASFGPTDAAGVSMRDPEFPTVPEVAELAATLYGHPPGGPLFRAWRSCAAAAQLGFGLELPALTPAGMVALWRQAASGAVRQPALAAALTADGLRPLTGAAALATARTLALDMPGLLALRQWLSTRKDWHLG